jgi:hypothetical protein
MHHCRHFVASRSGRVAKVSGASAFYRRRRTSRCPAVAFSCLNPRAVRVRANLRCLVPSRFGFRPARIIVVRNAARYIGLRIDVTAIINPLLYHIQVLPVSFGCGKHGSRRALVGWSGWFIGLY